MGMYQTVGSNERLAVLEGSRQRTVAAAGSAQTDATLIGANLTIVSGASGTNGVVLRKNLVNAIYAAMIYTSAATNALLIYPPLGGTINGASANTALSLPAKKSVTIYAIKGSQDFIANISA